MSFDALMKEVGALADDERRKLLAYMVTLADRDDASYREKLARKIDDAAPGRWFTPEQIERELGLTQP